MSWTQPGAANRRDVGGRQSEFGRGAVDEVGDTSGMAGPRCGPKVGEVGDGLERGVQLGLGQAVLK